MIADRIRTLQSKRRFQMAVKNINGQQKQAMGRVDRPLMETMAFAL